MTLDDTRTPHTRREPDPVSSGDQPITEGQMLRIAAVAAEYEHDAILSEENWQSSDWRKRVKEAGARAKQTREDYEAHGRDQWKGVHRDLPW